MDKGHRLLWTPAWDKAKVPKAVQREGKKLRNDYVVNQNSEF